MSASESRIEPVCGPDAMMTVPARITAMHEENFNTHTFRLEIADIELRRVYRFSPGQFNMIFAPGVGEAAISISSDAEQTNTLEHTIREVGSVTRAIQRAGVGGIVGLRGPFGRGWPMELLTDHDVVIVAGGIGLAPLRPVIYGILRHRELYRRCVVLYGCRTPADRLFAGELEEWADNDALDVLVTVDNATADWIGPVGVVTKLLPRIKVSAERTVVLVCGPRMLNRVAAWSFLQLHVPSDHVYVSLERNMHCGYGRCGHCQYGSKFVCKDGPVFRFDEIADYFAKEEI
jgi:NAD(P)H-flavin reductase